MAGTKESMYAAYRSSIQLVSINNSVVMLNLKYVELFDIKKSKKNQPISNKTGFYKELYQIYIKIFFLSCIPHT